MGMLKTAQISLVKIIIILNVIWVEMFLLHFVLQMFNEKLKPIDLRIRNLESKYVERVLK